MLSRVVEKLVGDSARAVVVVPKWESASWWQDLDCITVNFWDLPIEFCYLKENGQVLPAPAWATRVCIVDGALAVNDSLCVFLSADSSVKSLQTELRDSSVSFVNELSATISSVIEARGDDLTSHSDVRDAMSRISSDFSSVFTSIPPGDPPVRCPSGLHTVHLKPGVTPKCKRPYQLPPEREKALEDLLDEVLRLGWIEPADDGAEWASPAFPVPKTTKGKWRLVVDYRELNEATIRDVFPLPIIDQILEKQGHGLIFSVIDLKYGFFQVPLAAESRVKTAFVTPRGLFQWRVMLMGLTNPPSRFQRMMTDVLRPAKASSPYMDDILISTPGCKERLSECVAQHEKDLRNVLELLQKNKLFVEQDKCRFFKTEVEYCGHLLSNGTRRASPKKMTAIETWPVPTTVRQLRSFLGLAGFYSPFIRHYAKLAAPLTDLLQQGSFSWQPEHDVAFRDLKAALLNSVVLHIVRYDRPFVIRTDASKVAVGAVLEQHSSEGELRPVAFYSRKLTKAQHNWPPREFEMYAIVMSLMKWQSMIGMQPVTVLTDHESLKYWHSEHVATPSGPSGRRARWHDVLSRFNITIEYVSGKTNSAADALSRRWEYPADNSQNDVTIHGTAEDAEELCQSQVFVAPVTSSSAAADFSCVALRDWSSEYSACPRWSTVYHHVVTAKKLLVNYFWNGKRLFLCERICVPNSLCSDIVQEFHCRAHFGVDKTISGLCRRYDISDLNVIVKGVVSRCPVCQACKTRNQKPAGLLQSLPIPDSIFQSVSVDFLELPKITRGSVCFDYVLVVLCRLSSFCVLVPTNKAGLTSQVVAELLLRHVFSYFFFSLSDCF